MPDYQNGKIYKILYNIDDEIYVGSTWAYNEGAPNSGPLKAPMNPINKIAIIAINKIAIITINVTAIITINRIAIITINSDIHIASRAAILSMHLVTGP